MLGILKDKLLKRSKKKVLTKARKVLLKHSDKEGVKSIAEPQVAQR